jgi:thymidylate synthase
MHINCLSPHEAFYIAVRTVRDYGELVVPRNRATRELTNVTIQISEPWQIPFEAGGRELRPFIGAVEALQLVGQVTAPEVVKAGSRSLGAYTDDGLFHGAYGVRVHGDVGRVVKLLERDKESRQAILTIYDTKTDLDMPVMDTPCTLALQFLVRDEKLCLRTTMRSNDVWLGLPYDMTQFIALQGAIARALGREMGWYAHSVASLHIYEDDVNRSYAVEAPSQLSKEYQPLWTGRSIEDISRTARQILFGWPPDYMGQDFEIWCLLAMNDANEVVSQLGGGR